jgi:flavin-binding protein dodecin
MAKDRNEKPSTMGASNVKTGCDGAIDFVSKSELLERSLGDESNVDGHIYRVIEIVGTSEGGIEGAIKAAIERAHKTIRNLRWFKVARTSGHIVALKSGQHLVSIPCCFRQRSILSE